jgi:DNA repair protein SbcC/Rad50
MRPIRLTLHAFGPYADVQVVDFRQLGERSLFLVHGPTGAGKTMILDGMCFALYGETSVQGREPRYIRSDFAEPSVLTQVTLDFALGNQVYRVSRSPQQERPRRRSAGTTTVPPRATLWNRAGLTDEAADGSVVASQWSKVTEAVENLLGFRSDQFRQVVMLPQGEFRKLLLANSQERQQIFETLFQTEIYRRIEDALKDAAKEVVDGIKDLRRRHGLILEQASATSVEELRTRRQQADSQYDEVGRRVHEMRQREALAQRHFNEAAQVLAKIQERDTAYAALQGLESREMEFASKRNALEAARKAMVLVEAEGEVQRSIQESEESQSQLIGAHAAVAQARIARQNAEQFLQRELTRDPERQRAQQHLTQLEELTAKVDALTEARRAHATAQQEALRLTQARDALKQDFAARQHILEGKLTELSEARRLADQLDACRLAALSLERTEQQRRQLSTVRQQMAAGQNALTRARSRRIKVEETVFQARAQLTALETAWVDGQAAILAQQLRPGTPCPVCGSMMHPNPARTDQDLPTEVALKEQRLTVERLETVCDDARRQESEQQKLVIQFEAAVQSLEETLGELVGEEVVIIEGRARAARATVVQAEQAQATIPKLVAAMQQLKADETTAKERIAELEAQLQEATSAQAMAQAICEERVNGVPENLHTPEALAEAKQMAERRVKVLKEALDKAQEVVNKSSETLVGQQAALNSLTEVVAKARSRVETLQAEFSKRLQAAGFTQGGAFQQAKRNAAEIDHLEEEIGRFDGALRAARDRVERARQAADRLVLPDIEALESAARQAKADLEGALRAEMDITVQLRQLDAWLGDLCKTEDELEALEARYAVAGRIAEVASGHNAQGITFQRFVLAALLDDVLVAASERLHTMSRRRFSLQRATTRADRRLAGGLDLEVYDSYTGTTRAVSTLSGGESFLASLSLALGLADVVQAYAGGVHLDTLFVDEGFGSLDPEALDLAFRALVDLQRAGRLVGIISHVPELKERIDVRLEVISTQRGSVTRFIIP